MLDVGYCGCYTLPAILWLWCYGRSCSGKLWAGLEAFVCICCVAKHYRDLRQYGVNGKVIVEYCREKANSSPFVCPLASQLAEHHPVCGSLPIVAVGASSDWEPKMAEACERSRSQTSLERLAAVPWKFADVSHMTLAQTQSNTLKVNPQLVTNDGAWGLQSLEKGRAFLRRVDSCIACRGGDRVPGGRKCLPFISRTRSLIQSINSDKFSGFGHEITSKACVLMSFNNKPLEYAWMIFLVWMFNCIQLLWLSTKPRPISDAIPVPLPDAPENPRFRELARSNVEARKVQGIMGGTGGWDN